MAKNGKEVEDGGIMPGKPFRSRLEPHFEEIAQRRARRETWAGIAAELGRAYGVKVHFTAVQKFFGRYLTGRPRPLGFDPVSTTAASTAAAVATPSACFDRGAEPLGDGGPAHPDDENPFLMRRRQAQCTSAPNGEPAAAPAAPAAPARKYVFHPKEKRPSIFSEEDLQFNDPLAIDTFGGPVPADPDKLR